MTLAANTNTGNYTVKVTGIAPAYASKYTVSSIGNTDGTLTINPLPVILAGSRTYDGTATADFSILTVANIVPGDTVYVSSGSATLSGKNVPSQSIADPSGLTLGNNTFGNYTLVGATGSVAITARALLVSATGIDKVYDGGTNATVTLSDNRVVGDVLTPSYTAANFADKNVGSGKTVSVTGIAISGTDAGNYTFNTTALTAANITPATITVAGAIGVNKLYDTTTALPVGATGFTYAGVLGGDSVTVTAASAAYYNPNVGLRNVNVSGLNLSGGSAGNYQLSATSVIGSGTIGVAALNYAVANATFTFGTLPTPGAATLTGVLPGDTVTPIVGVFNGSNVLITLSTSTPVGTYAEKVIGLTGSSAANYIIANVGNFNGTLTIQDSGNVQASNVANTLGNKTANNQTSNGTGTQNCTATGIADQLAKTGSAVVFSGVGMGCGNP